MIWPDSINVTHIPEKYDIACLDGAFIGIIEYDPRSLATFIICNRLLSWSVLSRLRTTTPSAIPTQPIIIVLLLGFGPWPVWSGDGTRTTQMEAVAVLLKRCSVSCDLLVGLSNLALRPSLIMSVPLYKLMVKFFYSWYLIRTSLEIVVETLNCGRCSLVDIHPSTYLLWWMNPSQCDAQSFLWSCHPP